MPTGGSVRRSCDPPGTYLPVADRILPNGADMARICGPLAHEMGHDGACPQVVASAEVALFTAPMRIAGHVALTWIWLAGRLGSMTDCRILIDQSPVRSFPHIHVVLRIAYGR